MKTQQVLFPLLLIWLIFVAFQPHCASSSSLQETKSESLKISAAAYESRKTGGTTQKVWGNTKEATEKKVRKTPSGPSPVGNNRPPSKV